MILFNKKSVDAEVSDSQQIPNSRSSLDDFKRVYKEQDSLGYKSQANSGIIHTETVKSSEFSQKQFLVKPNMYDTYGKDSSASISKSVTRRNESINSKVLICVTFRIILWKEWIARSPCSQKSGWVWRIKSKTLLIKLRDSTSTSRNYLRMSGVGWQTLHFFILIAFKNIDKVFTTRLDNLEGLLQKMNVMQAELKKSQTVMRNQLDATTDEHRSMVELMKKTKNHTTSVHKDIK